MFPISDTRTSGRFPFWVFLFISINIFVFIIEFSAPNLNQIISQYALIPSQLNFLKIESLTPFITSQFLHGGFMHILSNMWFLWIFGDNVEEKFGSLLFPIFYLLSGIAGGLAQYLLNPQSDIPMLGASGAIAGVLGAYMSFFPKHTIKTLIPIFGFFTTANIPASVMLFYWFFTQLFSGTATIIASTESLGGIAFFAHVGGFAAGFILARAYNLAKES